MVDNPMSNNTLKPCPFCGTPFDSDEFPYFTPTKQFGYFTIGCANPECNAHIITDSEEQAIVAWNKRSAKV